MSDDDAHDRHTAAAIAPHSLSSTALLKWEYQPSSQFFARSRSRSPPAARPGTTFDRADDGGHPSCVDSSPRSRLLRSARPVASHSLRPPPGPRTKRRRPARRRRKPGKTPRMLPNTSARQPSKARRRRPARRRLRRKRPFSEPTPAPTEPRTRPRSRPTRARSTAASRWRRRPRRRVGTLTAF